jgi:hypothetical protein
MSQPKRTNECCARVVGKSQISTSEHTRITSCTTSITCLQQFSVQAACPTCPSIVITHNTHRTVVLHYHQHGSHPVIPYQNIILLPNTTTPPPSHLQHPTQHT